MGEHYLLHCYHQLVYDSELTPDKGEIEIMYSVAIECSESKKKNRT